jgi:hypothetical protein
VFVTLFLGNDRVPKILLAQDQYGCNFLEVAIITISVQKKKNPEENDIGAPSTGVAETQDGSLSYKYIKGYIRGYGATTIFNSTYV